MHPILQYRSREWHAKALSVSNTAQLLKVCTVIKILAYHKTVFLSRQMAVLTYFKFGAKPVSQKLNKPTHVKSKENNKRQGKLTSATER